ncbi:MAG: HemK/PrmC family methyltransferase [Planctomycetota bacterium]
MLARAREFLARKGCDEARLEAELLVAEALGLDRMGLFLALERPLAPAEIDRGRELLVRRVQGEPTAYLLGRREFYGRPFRVGPGVLVPRPETELVVDVARELAGQRPGLRVADFGTGSGCIAVTLALELTEPEVHAFELSGEALSYARQNAEALGADVAFVEGDGLAPLLAAAPFDLVVSNPPNVDPSNAAT